jgi:hypothetical protein
MFRPHRCSPSLPVLFLALIGALPSAAGEGDGGLPLRLRSDQVLPAQLGAEAVLERLADGARITLHAGERLSDLLPGAYRCNDHTLLVRVDDSAAGHALSVVGLPIVENERSDQQQAAALGARSLNEFSLAVYAWRMADAWPWPWVTHGSYWGGLSGICWRITVDGKPFAFDPSLGAYRRADRSAMPITGEAPSRTLQAARLGDFIAAKGVTGILVRDLGKPGVLDPADELVTACLVAGGPARVRVVRLGDLVGEQPIDIFTRDLPRGESRNRLAPDPDNPLHQLSLRRQLIALGGMFALCAILMLRYRRLRRQRRRSVSSDPRLGSR